MIICILINTYSLKQAQFAGSEKVNEEMRREVSSLIAQLTNHSEQTKVVKESESKVRDEKRKMEQQLLVASADKVSIPGIVLFIVWVPFQTKMIKEKLAIVI